MYTFYKQKRTGGSVIIIAILTVTTPVYRYLYFQSSGSYLSLSDFGCVPLALRTHGAKSALGQDP